MQPPPTRLLLQCMRHTMLAACTRGIMPLRNAVQPRSASPGRLSAFEDELFRGGEAGDAPLVAAVALGYQDGQRVVGAAYLDPGSR